MFIFSTPVLARHLWQLKTVVLFSCICVLYSLLCFLLIGPLGVLSNQGAFTTKLWPRCCIWVCQYTEQPRSQASDLYSSG